jgi:hypothetical protein
MDFRDMDEPVFPELRRAYHRKICAEILGFRRDSNVLNIADVSSRTSIELAAAMFLRMGFPACSETKSGQTAGTLFTQLTLEFVQAAFSRLAHLRPGHWQFSAALGGGLAQFEQYDHLAKLAKLISQHPDLAAALGAEYVITPDIVVSRHPVTDEEINWAGVLVAKEAAAACQTPLRAANQPKPRAILHASISCKWTMRSDRAQNTRTEALNLIRSRKGRTPHIMVATLEPLPSRLASLAMGTGDIDCAYHAALYELMEAVKESGNEGQLEMLMTLVHGRRLRDISDLPFDLAA